MWPVDSATRNFIPGSIAPFQFQVRVTFQAGRFPAFESCSAQALAFAAVVLQRAGELRYSPIVLWCWVMGG